MITDDVLGVLHVKVKLYLQTSLNLGALYAKPYFRRRRAKLGNQTDRVRLNFQKLLVCRQG